MMGDTYPPDGCARCGVPSERHGWRRHCGGYFVAPSAEQVQERLAAEGAERSEAGA